MSWPTLPADESGNEERKVHKRKPLPTKLLAILIYAVVWTPTALLASSLITAFSAQMDIDILGYVLFYVLGGLFVLVCWPPVNIVWAMWIAGFGSLQLFLSRSNFLKISWLGPERFVLRSLIAGLALGVIQAVLAIPVASAINLVEMPQPLSHVWLTSLRDFGLAGFAGSVACGFVLGLFLRKVSPAAEKAAT